VEILRGFAAIERIVQMRYPVVRGRVSYGSERNPCAGDGDEVLFG
jgi:hypothetical protein